MKKARCTILLVWIKWTKHLVFWVGSVHDHDSAIFPMVNPLESALLPSMGAAESGKALGKRAAKMMPKKHMLEKISYFIDFLGRISLA